MENDRGLDLLVVTLLFLLNILRSVTEQGKRGEHEDGGVRCEGGGVGSEGRPPWQRLLLQGGRHQVISVWYFIVLDCGKSQPVSLQNSSFHTSPL